MTRPLEPDDPADVGHTKRGMAIDPRAPSAAYAALSEAEKKAYARGSYIANAIADCNQCHTAPQRDLTPGSATYLKVNTAGFLAGGRYFDVATDLHPATQTRRTQCSNLSGAKNGLLKNLSYEEFRYIIKSKIFIDQNKKERLLGFPMFLQPYTKMTEDDIFAVYTYMKAQAPVEGEFDKIAQSPSRYCVSKDECKVGETCDLTSHECYGKACAVDTDCDVCQTCSVTKTCAVPDPKSTCVAKSALMY